MKTEMKKSVAFVRFISHDATAGHFESLRLSQAKVAASSGVNLHFWDFSESSPNEAFEKISRLARQFSISHIYCEWLHDIADIREFDFLIGKLEIDWSVLASISEIWNTKQDSFFQKQICHLQESLNLSAVFIWDRYAVHNIPNNKIPFVVIPDSQSVETNSKNYSCCSWNTRSNVPTIGIVGQLYGYRGTSALIQMAARHKELRYIFWGVGRWSTISIRHRFMLKILQKLNVVYVNDSFKSDDEELNHGFKHLDAVFLDGAQYPNPSGIITRARHFGIPVLINSGSGFYKSHSKIDKGIRMIDLQKITQTEICDEITEGKKFASVATVSEFEQAKIFIGVWGGGNE